MEERWLLDNIIREVGDERSTFFWRDVWLDGQPFDLRFSRLSDLATNKLAIVAEMYVLGWGVDGGNVELEKEIVCMGG